MAEKELVEQMWEVRHRSESDCDGYMESDGE